MKMSFLETLHKNIRQHDVDMFHIKLSMCTRPSVMCTLVEKYEKSKHVKKIFSQITFLVASRQTTNEMVYIVYNRWTKHCYFRKSVMMFSSRIN